MSLAAVAWLFFVGVIVQVFLAGVGLFELTDWSAHRDLGWGLGSAPILILAMAVPARLERRTIWLIVGLTVVAIVQPELAAARKVAPVVAALHPVNALALFWLAWMVARRATDEARRIEPGRPRTPAAPASAMSPAEPSA
jgi:hypothetical protein